MGIRRDAREWALQFLFQSEFNSADTLDEGFRLFWEEQDRARAEEDAKAARLGRPAPDAAALRQQRKELRKARRFAEELVRGVLEHWKDIDADLARLCDNWDVERMGVVDRNVMRIAMFEMKWRDDIPPVVSINEAVDLAKMFSSTESGRFVNGILDRYRKELPRDPRAKKAATDKPEQPENPESPAPSEEP